MITRNILYIYLFLRNVKTIFLNLDLLVDYVLRLANGNRKSEGRVEIFYNDTWGTVCDDSWDLRDAIVVCRQLGYPSALTAKGSASFGSGIGQIWLDDVGCLGSESSIDMCPRNKWGDNNCDHSEDASVVCKG